MGHDELTGGKVEKTFTVAGVCGKREVSSSSGMFYELPERTFVPPRDLQDGFFEPNVTDLMGERVFLRVRRLTDAGSKNEVLSVVAEVRKRTRKGEYIVKYTESGAQIVSGRENLLSKKEAEEEKKEQEGKRREAYAAMQAEWKVDRREGESFQQYFERKRDEERRQQNAEKYGKEEVSFEELLEIRREQEGQEKNCNAFARWLKKWL